jgi:methylmalonyl-CoA mutase N-terminal domain/subunit
MQARIEEASYEEARRQESGESVVVGVNRFRDEHDGGVPAMVLDPALEGLQRARLKAWKESRSESEVTASLRLVERTAAGPANLLHPIREALRVGATLGEVTEAMARSFGRHHQ